MCFKKELPAMMQRVPFLHQFFQQRDFLRVFFAAGVHAVAVFCGGFVDSEILFLRRADGTLRRFPCAFRSLESEPRRRSRAPLTRQRSSARHVFQMCARARQSGANPPLAAGFEMRSTARKATFPEAGRRCHRRKSDRLCGATARASRTKAALPRGGSACVRLLKTASIFLRSFGHSYVFVCPPENKKSSGTSSISPRTRGSGAFLPFMRKISHPSLFFG